jgi:chromosome segregation ATPase
MNTPLPLTLIELLILIAGGIMLGITIHFFIVSRKALNESSPMAKQKINKELEERKLRYLNDIEWKNKEIDEFRKNMAKLEEENENLAIEIESLQEKNKKLIAQSQVVAETKPVVPVTQAVENRSDLADQLKETQAELRSYGERIHKMIQRIEGQDDSLEKQRKLEEENEALQIEVEELTLKLEKAQVLLNSNTQKKEISAEMSSMLDNAFTEFGTLQEKINKLEGQVTSSHRINMDFQDAQEEVVKLTRLLEEEKAKYSAVYSEKREMEEEFNETEDKLREANFQRQQMQKRISYLEELNLDLQSVAEANNKLQAQLKRELESMLQILSEEKQELMRRNSREP